MASVSGVNTGSLNNLSPTNYLNKYKNPSAQIPDAQPDKIIITRDLIADLKLNKDKAAAGNIVEGTVNKSPATFKVVSNHEKELWYEGVLGKNYMLLHCDDKKYDGKYGNSEFKLTVDYNEPSKLSKFINQTVLGKSFIPDYFTVKGTIGSRAVNITLPNARIPHDIETCNLLTMILEDNGYKAQTINGEVKSLKFSSSSVKAIKEKMQKRQKAIDDNVKPLIMQGISTAVGMIGGALCSALLFKLGIKR